MARTTDTATRRRNSRLASIPMLLGAFGALACSENLPTEGTISLPLSPAYSHEGHTGTNGRSFDLALSQEVTATFSGDPDGAGTVLLTLNAGQQTVCWSITAYNIALPATASHIHRGPAGVAGPIVLGLTPPDATGNASGCATGVNRELIVDILRNPAGYYANVHTTEYRPGAIRSQLK